MIRFGILLFFFLILLSGCRSPHFAKGGVFVEDVDRYFNTHLQNSNVWLYMDLKPFNGGKSGLKIAGTYEEDMRILKSVDVDLKGTRLLFSAVPESSPRYHLIALYHKNGVKKLDGYEKKDYQNAHYFQKDLESGRLDVRHVYIPYKDQAGLSLIYYISTEQHLNCRFCKIDYLARINAQRLQEKNTDSLKWQISNCEDDVKRKNVSIEPKLDFRTIDQINYVKVYIDFLNGNTGIQYFQIFKSGEAKKLQLELCPGKYYVEYQDAKFNVLYRDTLHFDN
ncbi:MULTISPECIES: hypothetical protein [Sphingobacterium]|uniref:hypothetical protein n=1 Tax=Sphingobacterium TaxID=28453 RepID=UPI0013DD5670|nr:MULTISPECIES: hypothetical protein [unclassified Sphingobacterium]